MVQQPLVRRIDQQFGVGGVVDAADLAVADAEVLMHHLHHRREAVRRERGRRGDEVKRQIVGLVVDAYSHVGSHYNDICRTLEI